ncbi:hypothetical protein SK128_007965, partial [Halocaridina rubra]
MEAEAAAKLFGRSEELNFRYVSFVGDEDSSVYIAVTAMNNGYGPYQDHQTSHGMTTALSPSTLT